MPKLQTQTRKELSTLKQVSLAFPVPGGRACIAVVNGFYHIQQLPPTFGLWMHNFNSLMEVLFNGIQNRQRRIHILITIQLPIQGHVGR